MRPSCPAPQGILGSGQAVAIFVVVRPGQRLTESELLDFPRAADGLQGAETGGVSRFPAQNQRG